MKKNILITSIDYQLNKPEFAKLKSDPRWGNANRPVGTIMLKNHDNTGFISVPNTPDSHEFIQTVEVIILSLGYQIANK